MYITDADNPIILQDPYLNTPTPIITYRTPIISYNAAIIDLRPADGTVAEDDTTMCIDRSGSVTLGRPVF
ncbi:ankyrin repeat protein [Salmonella phage 19]|nr:ankyrin repeat protein [Salmonella phage 19]